MLPLREDCIFNTHITATFYYAENANFLKNISDLSTIGGRIRYYRLSKGLLQEDLSKLSGIDRITITRYENNQVLHSLDILNKLAITMEMDPALIYDGYLKFISSNFGNMIKLKRKQLKLTQSQFSDLLGIHRKTISRWEKEKIIPARENYYLFKNLIEKQ